VKYHCGHLGCDICGARHCSDVTLMLINFNEFEVCEACARLAVKIAVDMAETFGGTIIDPAKPCGNITTKGHGDNMAEKPKNEKMALDWNKIGDVADEVGEDILAIIKPFLPALKREGEELFEGFIKHLLDKDYDKIDRMMYEKMTIEERRELEDAVLRDARDAVRARFRRKELTKQILTKALIRIALALL